MFTGSGFPMRFADTDGSLIDVYQAATQMTDESDIDIPKHVKALLDGALGPQGYYGVFTANMHTDSSDHPGENAIVAEATARGVPVVSAAQMLDWLDGRNDSAFQALSYSDGTLRFKIAPGAGARGLQAMVPLHATGGALTGLTRDGATVTTTPRTIKGVDYAVFDALPGQYAAGYPADEHGGGGPVDSTAPETTIGDGSVTGSSASFAFTSDDASARFECRLDGSAFAPCTSPAGYTGLAAGTHAFAVRAVDPAGNADPTPAMRSFTIAAAAPLPATPAPTPAAGGAGGSPPVAAAPRVDAAHEERPRRPRRTCAAAALLRGEQPALHRRGRVAHGQPPARAPERHRQVGPHGHRHGAAHRRRPQAPRACAVAARHRSCPDPRRRGSPHHYHDPDSAARASALAARPPPIASREEHLATNTHQHRLRRRRGGHGAHAVLAAAAPGSVTDDTSADFQAGTTGTATQVVAPGSVQLARTRVQEQFAGNALPAGMSVFPWDDRRRRDGDRRRTSRRRRARAGRYVRSGRSRRSSSGRR